MPHRGAFARVGWPRRGAFATILKLMPGSEGWAHLELIEPFILAGSRLHLQARLFGLNQGTVPAGKQ